MSVFTTDTGIRIVSSDSIRDIRILENIATIRIVRISTDSTKVWIKSYESALVRIRWKFSDEALWIRGLPTNR